MGSLRGIACRAGVVAALVWLVGAGPVSAETITMNFDVDFSGRALTNGTPLNVAYPSRASCSPLVPTMW